MDGIAVAKGVHKLFVHIIQRRRRATGTVCRIDRLSGVCLVSRADLPDAVLRVVSAARELDRAAPPKRSAAEAEPAEPPIEYLPMPEPAPPREAPEPIDTESYEAEPLEPEPQTPGQLLTPEELAALLEDGS